MVLPYPLAVTKPLDVTVATLLLLLLQLMVYSAFSGNTVAVNCFLPLSDKIREEILSVILVGATADTVTSHVAFMSVPRMEAVTVAFPLPLASTIPSTTVTTFSLLEVQSMSYSASAGLTVGFSVFVSPIYICSEVLSSVMLLGSAVTVT